ncbi:hypothetical protein O181_070973 [Austropuccinia psidii MF-1]|uniref:Retrotransposon gag domain-containing protein n=1 Tax=Austropuccinia psidii MF-1 TaxID=1389203 RepID=A0A9Q3F062_9BASI|nr:hypothetical protein [Austropuccinia psidii MF-1]
MWQITQAAPHRDNVKAPAFKTPSIKAYDSFYGAQANKLRGFIQFHQLIFHNHPEDFFSDRNKVLYSTSVVTGRVGKWIEPYLSNIFNEDPSNPLINWKLFETQLLSLFGDPNEFRESEQDLDNLRMKESGHVSLYIAYFRILMSRTGDWGERHIFMFTEGDWHQEYWISWLLTMEYLIPFRNSWISPWN